MSLILSNSSNRSQLGITKVVDVASKLIFLDCLGQVSTLNGPLNIEEPIIDLGAGLEHYALLTKHGRPELTPKPIYYSQTHPARITREAFYFALKVNSY